MTEQISSFQRMRLTNRAKVLNQIRLKQPISRAVIAKETQLTPATVTNIVQDLLEEKMIKEGENGSSQGGRKPILLSIDDRSKYIIGIDIGAFEVRMAITNLQAVIIRKKDLPLSAKLDNSLFLSYIEESIQNIIEESRLDKQAIVGIGIGMHGVVNAELGTAIFAPNFQLVDVPIKSYLETKVQIPVYVENDVRAFTLGESWFGAGKGINHFICVNVGVGIGAGIIYNGELYRGSNHIAGEFGHTLIDIKGEKCSCGRIGCLETVASGKALVEYVLQEKDNDYIMQQVNSSEQLTGELIFQCANQGDPCAIRILAKVGYFLGVGVTNLINLINPECIIVGGGVAKAGGFVLEEMRRVVKDNALTNDARNTIIIESELKDEGTLIGAVTLVLNHIFFSNHK
ncbi:ROK family transcriptional regulator [Alkalihalobacillus pseudalcaliphilus]|uniref:ROK family transcriptional regulator n=1 Tax=Alkalihalobacillus pseudalcaliphilus TaxID=79884 RepID=UPI00064D78C9|nr:ROK family transcriptional regulator [Alkalihalobacillus pseudalcaliphilus]KMK76230.1 ROK family transcriptional regulator [Alkalihalobacillus pseudalcaliphilus]